jgi:glycosyltransferase involved in cell wall biosynthesis
MPRMRILALTHLAPPDPARDVHGVYRRFRLFVRALAGLEHVDILHFVGSDRLGRNSEERETARSREAWGTPVRVRLAPINDKPRSFAGTLLAPFRLAQRGDFRPYAGEAQRAALRGLLAEGPDLVFAHRISMAELMRLAGGTRAPVIVDIDDIEHDMRLRAARSATSVGRAAASMAQVPALLLAERRAVSGAARAFVCSQADRARLAARGFDSRKLRVAPNALELPDMRAPLTTEPVLLFLGAFGHEPNRRAAERLIDRVWPRVTSRMPRARLLIAGARPERIAAFASPPPGVTFTGFAPDLDALYARVRAVCCPMDEGGGTRIKLIEAAGRGKPIISTAVGAEGLAFGDGQEILLAETDEELAEGALRLLTDDARADALAAAAFDRASRSYRAEAVERSIAAEIAAAAQSLGRTASTSHAGDDRHGAITAEAAFRKAPPCG